MKKIYCEECKKDGKKVEAIAIIDCKDVCEIHFEKLSKSKKPFNKTKTDSEWYKEYKRRQKNGN